MVIKYQFIDGTTNDNVSIFINPTLGVAEPSAGATISSNDSGSDPTGLNYVYLRQGDIGLAPTVQVDGIRVAKDWATVIAPAGSSITGIFNSATGILTLNGSATVAKYTQALQSVTYQNSNTINPSTLSRNITFQVTDGLINSNVLTRALNINFPHVPPVLDKIEKSVITYSKTSTSVTLTDSLTISHPDNPNLKSAIIAFDNGFIAAEDNLDFTNTSTITGVFDNKAGTLTLTGKETLAGYQSAIRSIKYRNSKGAAATKSTKAISITGANELDNSNKVSRSINVLGVVVSVAGMDNIIPTEFSLSQNYPNPFNPSTKIRYGLPKESNVILTIYNAIGAEVLKLVNGVQPAGYHEAVFNASALSSGIYFCRINAGEFTQIKKMMLIK